MHYLVDGHNLIPKIGGLSLRAVDDEEDLLQILQVFCRQARHVVEVYFDGAPAGQAGSRRYGTVQAHFVLQGHTADDAIAARLQRLKRSARNWTVVTSDRRVQAEAHAVQAGVISSEEFATLLSTAARQAERTTPLKDQPLSPQEVEKWLELFSPKGKKDELRGSR